MSRDGIAAAIKSKGEGGSISVYFPHDKKFIYNLSIKKITFQKKGWRVNRAILEKNGEQHILKTNRAIRNIGWLLASPGITPDRKVMRVD